MTRKELMMIECDMLKGNINLMMVADDTNELRIMYDWACKRLSTIYNERFQVLTDGKDKMQMGNP